MRVNDSLPRLLMLGAAIAPASLAAADFAGFACTRSVVTGELTTYHIVEVFAVFDDPADRLLNVFDMRVSLSDGLESGSKAVFHQASVDGAIPPSMLPLPFMPPGEQWIFDTYVTIGAEQGELLNGTVPDPDFNDANFTESSGAGAVSGWFNMPPSNGFGVAGDLYRVRLGQFVVTKEELQPDLGLSFAGTVGYSNDGVADFESDARVFSYPDGTARPYRPDRIDEDAISDIVFVSAEQRRVTSWLMQGLARKAGAVVADKVPPRLSLRGMGDLDGDGTADLVLRDSIDGRFHAWLLREGVVTLKAPISGPMPSNWRFVGVGDISGDGKGDIVVRDRDTGAVEAWLQDGVIRVAGGTLGVAAGLTPLGLGDVDGDMRADLLWRSSGGAVSGWRLEGLSIAESAPVAGIAASVASAWQPVGLRDLDGDTRADLVWQHASGAVGFWGLDGLARVSHGVLSTGFSPEWRVALVTDLNGDDRADLVWRHAQTGDVRGWLMDGFARLQGGFIRRSAPHWALVEP